MKHQKVNTLQKRYEGFLDTHCLWKNNFVYGLNQYTLDPTKNKVDTSINENLRLGKYVEQFVSFQIKRQTNTVFIDDNIQIQQEKRTIGEIDFLFLEDGVPIHLELIYKFYLYDARIGSTEIEHCIGPNKKDALIEKLTKLKHKQLPLLFREESKKYLNTYDLIGNKIQQKVLFKAQLFIPYKKEVNLKLLNNKCVVGYYLHFKDLPIFKNAKIYVPIKKDWLLKPHTNVEWLNFTNALEVLENFYISNISPMVWIKNKNGTLLKLFVTWWK